MKKSSVVTVTMFLLLSYLLTEYFNIIENFWLKEREKRNPPFSLPTDGKGEEYVVLPEATSTHIHVSML